MDGQLPEAAEKGNSESGESVGAAASGDASTDSGGGADICRDFLRNVCKRGRRCRYRHPEASPPASAAPEPPALVFCHDFQNGGCQRPACRFVHCSREEEVAFRTAGRLPDRFLLATLAGGDACGGGAFFPDDAAPAASQQQQQLQQQQQQPPVCKDHMKGECKRGARCRFRHLDSHMAAAAASAAVAPPPMTFDFLTALDPTALLMLGGAAGGVKRRRMEFELPQAPPQAPPQPLQIPFNFLTPAAALVDALQAENGMLKRRLEELRKQCGDLLATNEMLADQNARLRQQLQLPPQPQQTGQLDVFSAVPGYSELAYSALFAFSQAASQTGTVVSSAGMKAQLQ